ncbi:hypothetical protein [Gilvimarinus agarilyticus]|uniref:hypothetical protein n=1 Tax=Gilvimarinus agarilyticus TaxID=679259 RepID=UPI0012F875A2|nr:hypothetical protein [Gilvimarinus agarilyticus]
MNGSVRKPGATLVAVIATLLYGASAVGQECEPAVDLMESNDAVNRIAECDYSDEGLNGWLQGRGDAKPAEESSELKASADSAVAVGDEFTLSRNTIASALDMLQARYALVRQATEHCEGAAALIEESYMPEARGATGLYMKFYCR